MFRMFVNKLWRKTLGHGTELVTGGWRILYIEEIYGFYSSKNFIRAG
jgi:hypothetical protein